MKLEYQFIKYDGIEYPIPNLITASKDFEVFNLEVAFLYKGDAVAPDTTLLEFAEHMKLVMKSNLRFPIMLSPLNNLLDGRHRLTKAIYLGNKTIKAVKFETMPKIGF